MVLLAAGEIYRYARLAGFDPGQAATMTAIALAESGGETGAHNGVGEDSSGLWQINVAAHPDLAGVDLTDPLANARAAYEVSGGGSNISPWTVTHGGTDARYLGYQSEAQVAAQLNGDPAGGSWSGTDGYGDVVAANIPTGGTVAGSSGVRGTSALDAFLGAATAQEGDTYVFGAQASIDDPDPEQFDCSDLVRWSAGRAGVDLPDGSWNQYLTLKAEGMLIPIEDAATTPGAIVFKFPYEPVEGGGRPSGAHVAISMGDGRTIEAMNPHEGVRYANIEGRGFNFAAVIPGISDGTALDCVTDPALDSDGDGLTDTLEQQLGLDPNLIDTDSDGLSDSYELLVTGTGAGTADTDLDGVNDSHELVLGMDPLNPDSNLDGQVDGATSPMVDSDHDGLSDTLESLIGSNPFSADSDGDGFLDHVEYGTSYSLIDPASSPLAELDGHSGSGGLHSDPLDFTS